VVIVELSSAAGTVYLRVATAMVRVTFYKIKGKDGIL